METRCGRERADGTRSEAGGRATRGSQPGPTSDADPVAGPVPARCPSGFPDLGVTPGWEHSPGSAFRPVGGSQLRPSLGADPQAP